MTHSEGEVINIEIDDFNDLQSGDQVTRLLSSAKIPVPVTVEKIEDGLIYMKGGWTFDVNTGIEVDEELGWGPDKGISGSWLVREYVES